MAITKNATLVLNAESGRRIQLTEALSTITKGLSLEDVSDNLRAYGPWVRELNYVNQHITVPEEDIDAAAAAYTDVAKHLIKELGWSDELIEVIPQGSARTQTLIRSPGRDKFDIDAVCQVDISHVDIVNPVGFFNKVGDGLQRYSATAKKRCWNINYAGKPFYLEFTPSVPLEKVPEDTLASMAPKYLPSKEYLSTALAVVDNPTEKWKTSNPAGFSSWVNDTAQRQLIQYLLMKADSFLEAAGITPVPDQDIEITDTLRLSIRLFKRHRDMCIHRNIIDKEYKPISVIIVTLLTACYAGLADLGRPYTHPMQLLADLAELLPGMVDVIDGEYHVDNPTVPGENFAERWNGDGGKRHNAFQIWCDTLAGDIRTILAINDEQEIRREVRRIFGCNHETVSPSGPGGAGLTPKTRRPPPAVPKTSGLA